MLFPGDKVIEEKQDKKLKSQLNQSGNLETNRLTEVLISIIKAVNSSIGYIGSEGQKESTRLQNSFFTSIKKLINNCNTEEENQLGVSIVKIEGFFYFKKSGQILIFPDGTEGKFFHILEHNSNQKKEEEIEEEFPLYCVQDNPTKSYFIYIDEKGRLQKIGEKTFEGDPVRFYNGEATLKGVGKKSTQLKVTKGNIKEILPPQSLNN